MAIKLDFTGTADGDFSPLPAGRYPVTFFNIEMKTSTSSNQPYMAVTLKVTEGEFKGRNLWVNYSLQPKALWKLKQTLVRLGHKQEKLAGVFELEPNELLGMPAIAVVALRDDPTYGPGNEVKDVFGADGSGAELAASAAAAPTGSAQRLPF